jgi:endo-1,4-beta-xylanase
MTVRYCNSLLVLALPALFIVSSWASASVLDDAARNIDKYRKGNAVIEFVSPDGGKINNVEVTVEQTSHDFLFGNYIRPRHYNNTQYLNRFKELFNFVELLEFNWGQYEPDEGKPLLKERMNFIRNWCVSNGLTRFYGHMLVWTHQYDKYPRSGLPVWLFNYDKTTQYQMLEERIRREVTDYKDIDIMWDVVNEAVHCRIWGDWNKDSYIQNKSPEPLERIVPYVRDALTWSHQANPDAKLLINDYRVIVEGNFRRRYKQLIDTLISDKTPLSAIGIQAHEPSKGKYWYSPEELWRTYELFGSQTGRPIYITEFFYVSDERQQIRGNYRRGNWSSDSQADAVEEFYRVSFGHPSIEAIIYFGLTDSDVVQPKCGLLDEQYNPKPAWFRLKKLIREEWTTEAAGRTSHDGTFRFRGFFGRYKVTARIGNTIRKFKIHIEKNKPNHWRFNLNMPAK